MSDFPKEERNKYFVGLVGAWIFPDNLIQGMEKEEIQTSENVKVTVYDGENLLFTLGNNIDGKKEISETRDVQLLNKQFRFEFVATKILSPFSESLPLITALGLLVINAMWMLTVTLILISRRQAVRLADEATKDLVKFKQAVEGVSDQVMITNADGKLIYVNQATERQSGYKWQDLDGRKADFFEQGNEYYENLHKTLKIEKKPFWREIISKRKNGEVYEAELNVWPIVDEKGKLIYFVAIQRDLTKMKAMEKMKTEFISLASHQLRTPLSAVKWFGKMLLSGDAGELSPNQKSYMKKIYDSNEREISLVNSLLNVSRIESGKIGLVPRQTDLITLIRTVLVDTREEAQRGRKKISVILDKKIPEMMIDGDLVRHVYINLITNAIRYTKTGGKIMVKAYVDKNRVISEVKDDGIGIPKNEQKRIFEKFFRASNALKKETDGNGLGLYLAKAIVESSGGRMGFRSTEDKGTTFWFSLPIRSIHRIKKK